MSLTQAELGRRIRSAREACGLTQEQLGGFAGLSRVAVGQMESGIRSVSSLELEKIAQAVGRTLTSFFTPEFAERDALTALFRSDAALAEQTDLLQALQASLALGHELTNLERLLGIDRVQLLTATYELPPPKSRWEAIQQGQKVASEERQRLALGAAPLGDLSDLLEAQGVRTAAVGLPDNISGLTLVDRTIGIFVVVNARHAAVRRRFSLSHEYGHALFDRMRAGAISRTDDRADLHEVRANAFAAEFLMPAEGVAQFVSAFGKGGASREHVTVFDETAAVQVEQRAVPGSQDIQLYDVALLAHHYGASRTAALYRLKNLRLIDEREFQRLQADEERGAGHTMAAFLSAPEATDGDTARDDFRRRFLTLALEAYRREEITRSKLAELASMVQIGRGRLSAVLAAVGLD